MSKKKKADKSASGKGSARSAVSAIAAKKPVGKTAKKVEAAKLISGKSNAAKVAAEKPVSKKATVAAKPPAPRTPPPKLPPPKTAAPPARAIAATKIEPAKKSQGGAKKMAARAKISDIVLPPGYVPSENEPFMNEMHRAYFRKRLIEWKDEILRQTRETLAILHEDSTQHADLADRATSETDRATELRTRDRQRKLIAKIDAALARIEDGSYGYCEETGEPIGLKRLDARPIATLSVEAQERHERRERVYREE